MILLKFMSNKLKENKSNPKITFSQKYTENVPSTFYKIENYKKKKNHALSSA